MRLIPLSLSVISLFVLGCGSEPRDSPPPNLTKAFTNLPLPPQPELVSRTGSADALQVTFRSPVDVAQVTEYYRKILSQNQWRLVSDTKNPDGSTVLYAEQKGPPLWVRISKSDRGGSTVELTGAVTDPTQSMPSGQGSSSSPGR
jgi:hypothetical protein